MKVEKGKIEEFWISLADILAARSLRFQRSLKIKEGDGEEEIFPQVFELEKKNFRVDSAGWKQFTNSTQGITYLENFEGDGWEYIGGVPEELIGQQLFTWLAAIRETDKVGKRMPADGEFYLLEMDSLEKDNFGKIIYAGQRGSNGSFYDLSSGAYFWSFSAVSLDAWFCHLHSIYSRVCRDNEDQASGFSVRCLKG